MKQYNANILLVDQDHNYRTSLYNALSDCGYSVHETETAGEAIQHLQDYSNYDLVIWVPLSPAEILSFLEALREETSCPVLAVFRELSSEHRLTAYASGADDCIQTSISEEEMLAKVTALLRRYNEYRGKVISAYSVQFNPEARIVMKNGKIPDPNVICPVPGYEKEIYVKPTIQNPNIVVGDFTYIADSEFESIFPAPTTRSWSIS